MKGATVRRLDLPHLAATLFDTPHMIRRSKLDVILAAVAPKLHGGALPVRAFADEDDYGSEPNEGFTVQNGVAIIPVLGTLVRRGSWLDAASGLASYSGLKECVAEALAEPDVKAVLLEIDSNGGEAGGVFDLADEIRALSKRHRKPVWAHANECAASAAYAIACAADRIWVARTGEVGSIGVICAHLDQSQADAKAGLRWTFIYEGDHKTWGNPHEPLGDEAEAALQADVHALYEMFVAHVAQYRGMTPQAIRDTQADMFRGEAAITAGLADRVGTLDQAVAALVQRVDNMSTSGGAAMASKRGTSWLDAGPSAQPAAVRRNPSPKTSVKTISPKTRPKAKTTIRPPKAKTRT
jgi:signal peptide peptidase SppA